MADGQVTKGSEIVKPNVSHLAFCVQALSTSVQRSFVAQWLFLLCVMNRCVKCGKLAMARPLVALQVSALAKALGICGWCVQTLKKAKLHLVILCILQVPLQTRLRFLSD